MVKGKTKGSAKSVKYTPRVCPLLQHVDFSGATNKKISGPNQTSQIEGKLGIDTTPGGSLIISYYQCFLKDHKNGMVVVKLRWQGNVKEEQMHC